MTYRGSEIVAMDKRLVPLWLKIGYTSCLIIWTVLYAQYAEGAQHALWMCHIGLYLIAAALWTGNPLLMSWQAVSLLVADTVWSVDYFSGLAFHFHPFGATSYMFDPNMPLMQRTIALYHVAVPIILIWGLWRMGYDRRAFWWQVGTCCIVFPLSYLLGTPKDNINWVYGPFGNVQHSIAPILFLLVALVAYPLVVYVPTHLVLAALVRRPLQAKPIKA
jgi:hypothetical protein